VIEVSVKVVNVLCKCTLKVVEFASVDSSAVGSEQLGSFASLASPCGKGLRQGGDYTLKMYLERC